METIIGVQFPKKVIPLIDNSKKSIKILVFDWRWYPNDPANPVQLFNQAIIRAVKRCVEVKVITNIDEVVKVLKQNGCEAKKLITPKLVHAKMMIIDDNIVIIGSHNYTQSAFTMNYEISLLIENCEKVNELLTFFNNLFA